MSFSLLIVDPEGTARRWPVGKSQIRVGRGQANDLVIVGRGVSRLHALLTPEGDALQVEDQDSTYGTKVNGRQVRKASVGLGDHIDIGVFRLVLVPEMERIEEPFGGDRVKGLGVREDGQVMTRWDEPTMGVATTAELNLSSPYGVSSDRLSTAIFNTAESTSGIRRLLEAQESSDPYLGVRLNGAMEGTRESRPGVASEASMATRLEELARVLSQSPMGRPGAADLAAVLLVYRTAEKLTRAADLGTFLNDALDSLVKDLAAPLVALVRMDEVGKLQVVGARPQVPRSSKDIPISRSIVDQALRTGRPVQIRDTQTDAAFGPRDSVLASKLGAVLAVPLFVGDRTEGVLCLSRRAGQPFDDAEAEAVMGVAGLLGRALSLRELDVRAKEEHRRRMLLERFHSPEVVEQLYEESGAQGLREQLATVLYVELTHFEGLMERLGVAKTVQVSEAFRLLAQGAVFNNGGTLVWLGEDSGLALFGGQGTAESDAAWALAAATEMLRGFGGLARDLALPQKSALRLGLDRGPLMCGFLGPMERLRMAALGKPVTAARDAARVGVANVIHATTRVLQQVPNPRGSIKELEPTSTGLGETLYEITL